MKTRFQKAILLSGTALYLITAASIPMYSAPASFTVTDKSVSLSADGPMQPQGDPFPICPQCTPGSTN